MHSKLREMDKHGPNDKLCLEHTRRIESSIKETNQYNKQVNNNATVASMVQNSALMNKMTKYMCVKHCRCIFLGRANIAYDFSVCATIMRLKCMPIGVIHQRRPTKKTFLDPPMSNIVRFEDTSPPASTNVPNVSRVKTPETQKNISLVDVRLMTNPPPLVRSRPHWFPFPFRPDIFDGWPLIVLSPPPGYTTLRYIEYKQFGYLHFG